MVMGDEKPFATVKVPWKIVLDMEQKRRAAIVCGSCGAKVGREARCPECGSPMSYSLSDWKRDGGWGVIKWIIMATAVILLCLWFFTSA